MEYLPLFFDLHDEPVLIVGGGEVALRKARLLVRAGALIRVVAPAVEDGLRELILGAGGAIAERGFEAADLDRRRLVVAATDDETLNTGISTLCRQRGVAVNVVDQPELCTVIFPAIIDRQPVTIAVSSGGRAPVLTRVLRALIESTVPASYGRLAEFAGRFRGRVKEVFSDGRQRRHFWEDTLQGPMGEMVLAGRDDEANALMERALGRAGQSAAGREAEPASVGEVYLVGAGPGDPDLLTFKALRLMQRADIVLYDRLVAPAIVDLCRADARRVYVGKRRDQHALPQQEINALLLDTAQQGKRVLRLKGGDPFIFGRGGEEIEQLAEHGIPFQVVPGITAASGCACYAGIPLTHRDYAQSVRFVTGHLKNGTADLNWAALVEPTQTVVFYMGLLGLPVICKSLIAHGRAPETPIALIEKGTTDRQRVVVGVLSNIAELVDREPVSAPTLIIVGEVVTLHSTLRWFGDRPTEGI